MAEVVVFHHAHGRTEGVAAFADGLGRAGHTVHVPDLYEGGLFADPSLPTYDEAAATLLTDRVLRFLAAIG